MPTGKARPLGLREMVAQERLAGNVEKAHVLHVSVQCTEGHSSLTWTPGVGSVGASGVSHSDAKVTPSVTSQAEDKMHSALGDTLVSWGSRLDISWGYKCRYTCDTNVCELSICTAGVVSQLWKQRVCVGRLSNGPTRGST